MKSIYVCRVHTHLYYATDKYENITHQFIGTIDVNNDISKLNISIVHDKSNGLYTISNINSSIENAIHDVNMVMPMNIEWLKNTVFQQKSEANLSTRVYYLDIDTNDASIEITLVDQLEINAMQNESKEIKTFDELKQKINAINANEQLKPLEMYILQDKTLVTRHYIPELNILYDICNNKIYFDVIVTDWHAMTLQKQFMNQDQTKKMLEDLMRIIST